MDESGVFQRMSSFDDATLAEVFAREVLRFLVGRELLSQEWAERLLSWRHTGFSVHSRVRANTKPEAERVEKYRRAVVTLMGEQQRREPLPSYLPHAGWPCCTVTPVPFGGGLIRGATRLQKPP